MHKSNWWKYLLAVVIVIFHVLPLYVLVVMAFKTKTDMSSLLTIPNYFYPDNFIKIFKKGEILNAFKNTAIVTVCVLFLEIVAGGLASYPLARNKSKWNQFISSVFMGIMMIPSLSILVGVYSLLVSIHGISTIYLYTNFINAIPESLDEASAIDGCNVFQSFFKIILPQLKPVTVTVLILNGVGIWNEYAYGLYILQKPKTYTLTLMISQYFSTGGKDFNGAAAAACIAIMPIVIAYICLQKYFIQGTIDSAVKG